MEGKQFCEKLKKNQQDCYNKRLAYEQSQFHQCIPNPDPEKQGQMITVQLVRKALTLEGTTDRDVAQQYQNYTIESVNDKSLYDHENCKYEPSNASGVSAFHYANVVAVDSKNTDDLDAMTTCNQYAVVAFWDVSEWNDCFKC